MKILQINKFYYLKGGSERYFLDLSHILSEKGHKIIPFSMADGKNDYSEYNKYFTEKMDVNKFRIKNIIKFFYNYDAVRKLKKLIKNEHPDIAHLHNIAHHISPAIISLLKKNNIPIAQTLHDYKLICPNYKLFNKEEVCEKCVGGKYYNCICEKCIKNSYLKSLLAMLEAYFYKRTYKKVDVFIAPSVFMKDMCVKSGVPNEKIKVLSCFLSNEMMSVKNSGDSFKIFDDSENYILYWGRIEKEKGINILIDAMEMIRRELRLKIVGDGSEKKNIEMNIKNKGLQDRVEVLPAKYGGELKSIIKGARAVIVPSIWPEVFGYVLIEAMAQGIIPIVSRIGGMQEIIQDGINGFLFKPGDEIDLAEKINNLDKFDLDKIRKNAKIRVSALNGENHYKEIIDVYNKLDKNLQCHKL